MAHPNYDKTERWCMDMEIRETLAWVYYMGDQTRLDPDKSGKWMYYFDGDRDAKRVAQLCQKAVEDGVVEQAKHTNENKGVSCFYLNIDDTDGHKKILSFFLENDMIQKTKGGKLYNISFKLDTQTRAGEYGYGFRPKLTLDKFLNLYTGEWLIP